MVHLVSHHVFQRNHPGLKPHHWRHSFIERRMVSVVIERGWDKGALRRAEPAPEVEIKGKWAEIDDSILAAQAQKARLERKLRRYRTLVRKKDRKILRLQKKRAELSSVEG